MKIAIACDHGGLNLKKAVKESLAARGLECRDFGTDSAASCDYADYAYPVTEAVTAGECRYGILVCGTGIGMCMAAGKAVGIRAALCGDVYSAKMTRAHNDANILCLGERVTGIGHALEIVNAFLDTEFEGGRHAVRIGKIAEYERSRS